MKGELSLANADVVLFEEVQVHITVRGEKKTVQHLRMRSHEEASAWFNAVAKEIQFTNIQLLHQGSRQPEIIEWYYQYQSDLYRKHQFLSKQTEITLHLFAPFSGLPATEDDPTLFHISVRLYLDCLIVILKILLTGAIFCLFCVCVCVADDGGP